MSQKAVFFEKSLAARISDIEGRITAAKKDATLAAPITRLMGVSKTQTQEIILEAIATGLNLFGENRVQEAMEKWPAIHKQYPEIELHLIGHLQSNKAREAMQLFDVIETVDSKKLIDAFIREFENAKIRQSAVRTNAFYIQINTGEESQKGGVLPNEAGSLIAYAKDAGLNVSGLMCIPPEGEYPAPHFALLRKIAQEHKLKELSMGMSHDYELASRMGASIVRVGSALFGERS